MISVAKSTTSSLTLKPAWLSWSCIASVTTGVIPRSSAAHEGEARSGSTRRRAAPWPAGGRAPRWPRRPARRRRWPPRAGRRPATGVPCPRHTDSGRASRSSAREKASRTSTSSNGGFLLFVTARTSRALGLTSTSASGSTVVDLLLRHVLIEVDLAGLEGVDARVRVGDDAEEDGSGCAGSRCSSLRTSCISWPGLQDSSERAGEPALEELLRLLTAEVLEDDEGVREAGSRGCPPA